MSDTPADVRKRLATKREKLATVQANRAAAEQKGADELEVATLAAEEARLDSEIAAATEGAKVSNVKAGYASNLEAAKAAMSSYGQADASLPKDGSTVEKPMGIDPDGTVHEAVESDVTTTDLPNSDKAGTKGGAR